MDIAAGAAALWLVVCAGFAPVEGKWLSLLLFELAIIPYIQFGGCVMI
jgi:hypothetical protein